METPSDAATIQYTSACIGMQRVEITFYKQNIDAMSIDKNQSKAKSMIL
jgi:hypothetical protein